MSVSGLLQPDDVPCQGFSAPPIFVVSELARVYPLPSGGAALFTLCVCRPVLPMSLSLLLRCPFVAGWPAGVTPAPQPTKPPTARPRCSSDLDCPDNQVCYDTLCKNPCDFDNMCAPNALCDTRAHRPVCRCPEGSRGDSRVQCLPDKRKSAAIA